MKWATALSFQKNLLKPNTASHNNASWYTDTNGFPEHSPSRGSLLQGACPPEDNAGFFLVPLVHHLYCLIIGERHHNWGAARPRRTVSHRDQENFMLMTCQCWWLIKTLFFPLGLNGFHGISIKNNTQNHYSLFYKTHENIGKIQV